LTGPPHASRHVVVFDIDGTLLDSDEPLIEPFLALGVPRDDITFGHVLADECRRLGIDMAAYLDAYDVTAAQPFPGVEDLLAALGEWHACSNKVGRLARAELQRLGWAPGVAWFAEDFAGPKSLEPVLRALDAEPASVVFVGDTAHDRRCAHQVGARFALAGWNPRAVAEPGDLVLAVPGDLLGLLAA
jgi:phosphoglycolate phosphatase-like HAD superfamily hydrolase